MCVSPSRPLVCLLNVGFFLFTCLPLSGASGPSCLWVSSRCPHSGCHPDPWLSATPDPLMTSWRWTRPLRLPSGCGNPPCAACSERMRWISVKTSRLVSYCGVCDVLLYFLAFANVRLHQIKSREDVLIATNLCDTSAVFVLAEIFPVQTVAKCCHITWPAPKYLDTLTFVNISQHSGILWGLLVLCAPNKKTPEHVLFPPF